MRRRSASALSALSSLSSGTLIISALRCSAPIRYEIPHTSTPATGDCYRRQVRNYYLVSLCSVIYS